MSHPVSVLQGRCCILDELTTQGFDRSDVPVGRAFPGKVCSAYSKVSILTALGKMLWANRNGFWKQSKRSSLNCNGHRTEMGKNPISLMYKSNPNTDPTVGYFVDDLWLDGLRMWTSCSWLLTARIKQALLSFIVQHRQWGTGSNREGNMLSKWWDKYR